LSSRGGEPCLPKNLSAFVDGCSLSGKARNYNIDWKVQRCTCNCSRIHGQVFAAIGKMEFLIIWHKKTELEATGQAPIIINSAESKFCSQGTWPVVFYETKPLSEARGVVKIGKLALADQAKGF